MITRFKAAEARANKANFQANKQIKSLPRMHI